MIEYSKAYWEKHYSEISLDNEPSDFAKFIYKKFKYASSVIEFGSGNGRDSFWFAQKGLEVFASDISESAIKKCNLRAEGLKNISYKVVDYKESTELKTWISQFAGNFSNSFVYIRFLLHAVDELAEINILNAAGDLMDLGSQGIAFEFRTSKDKDLPKISPLHYRRFINIEEFEQSLKNRNLGIQFQSEGFGLAPKGLEDPYVARYIVGRQ